MEYDDTITVVTGLLNQMFVERLISAYKDVKHKMVSTWRSSNRELLRQLLENGFIIVLSQEPATRTMVRVTATSRAAVLKAQELGFKYICRSRTDIFPENHLKFLDVTRDLYKEKITVLSGVNLCDHIYYFDHIVCGSVENMLLFYTLKGTVPLLPTPEISLLQNYAGEKIVSKEEVKKHLNISKAICLKEGIEIIWYRPKDYPFPRTIPFSKLISEYCVAFFSFD